MNRPIDSIRSIPVFVVIPPRLLLLDVAGPLEVLRKADLEQQRCGSTFIMSDRTKPCSAP